MKALAYINNYQFKSWRDLKKKFSIEVFAYDMNEAKSRQIKAKENAMILPMKMVEYFIKK